MAARLWHPSVYNQSAAPSHPSDWDELQPFNYLTFCLILRLGSGEKQLIVSGINYATKRRITPRTFKVITFKPALVDMWCDTSIESKTQAATRAHYDLECL